MQRTGEFQMIFTLVFAAALVSCGKSVRMGNVAPEKDLAAENSGRGSSDTSAPLNDPLLEKQGSADQQVSAPVNIAGANLVSFECRDFALASGKQELACVSQWDTASTQLTSPSLRSLSFAARQANGDSLPLQFSSMVYGSGQVLHFASMSELPAATLQNLQTGAVQSAPTIQIGQIGQFGELAQSGAGEQGSQLVSLAVTPLLSLQAFPLQRNPALNSAVFEEVLASQAASMQPALNHAFVDEVSTEQLDKGSVAELAPRLSSEDLSPAELQALCQSGDVKTSSTTTLAFSPVGESCLFGKAGNLAKSDGIFTARSEFSSLIGAPAGTVVCAVQFAFQAQNFTYSDKIKFTVADQTVARSFDSAGLVSDDWNSLKGQRFDAYPSSYCAAGLGNCNVPVAAQAAQLNISGTLTVFEHPVKKISVGMTVYGDRDSSDCKHSGANVSVRYTYVQVD